MAEAVIKLAHKEKPAPRSATKDDDLMARIRSRQSKEIVIGLAGAVGCNLKDVYAELKRNFEFSGYEVRLIKVSDLIKRYYEVHERPQGFEGADLDNLTGAERYRTLQSLGNHIRAASNPYALAAHAIAEISFEREEQLISAGDQLDPPRTVYIVDQLKHPAEVQLFKTVYRNVFYLVGILSPEDTRLAQLEQEQINKVQAQILIERDRNENDVNGQKLEKTIQYADFFIRHEFGGAKTLAQPCERFVGLVHGSNGLTPTSDESGMYAAHSASLKSACLSRQVGASIADESGAIISLGWNDVPKAGGGLYSADDGIADQRCVHKGGKCHNDAHKANLVEKILAVLKAELSISTESATSLSQKIMKDTPVGSLIEYSRAVHAEMEAILNLARTDGRRTKGATLYSTTYPCHNCARHIIAAGISRVVYIEPYEKSLAVTLHGDAISKEVPNREKVIFQNFEGASPSRYAAFFGASLDRKDAKGLAKRTVNREANLISTELLDSYIDVESKVAELVIKAMPPEASA